MVIQIRDLVSGADTADQGSVVLPHVLHALQDDGQVTISFAGVQNATSSFVSAAIVPLLRAYAFTEIKRRLRIVESTRQINQMIKSRLERESLVDA